MIILPSSKGIISRRGLLTLPEVAIGYTPTWLFRPEGAKDINGDLITENNTDIYSITSAGSNAESMTFTAGSLPPVYEKRVSWAKNRPAIRMIGNGGIGGRLSLTSNENMIAISTRNRAVMYQVCVGISFRPYTDFTLLEYSAGSLGSWAIRVNNTQLYISNLYGTNVFVTNYSLNTPYTLCIYRFSYLSNICRIYNNGAISNTSQRIGFLGNYQPIFHASNNLIPFYLFEIIGYAANRTTSLGATQPSLGYNYLNTKYGLGN
jgi:hypothetical protein